MPVPLDDDDDDDDDDDEDEDDEDDEEDEDEERRRWSSERRSVALFSTAFPLTLAFAPPLRPAVAAVLLRRAFRPACGGGGVVLDVVFLVADAASTAEEEKEDAEDEEDENEDEGSSPVSADAGSTPALWAAGRILPRALT